MSVARRFLIPLAWIGCALAPIGHAASTAVPPINADLTAALRWLDFPEAPLVQSRAQSRINAEGRLELELSAQAPGLAVHGIATVPDAARPGSWKITQGEMDLEAWWRVTLARYAPAVIPADLKTTGNVAITGGGTWGESMVSGEVSGTLAKGSAASEEKDWSAAGVSLATEIQLEQNRPNVRTSRLVAASAEVAGVQARNVEVEVTGAADRGWTVQRFQLEAFGGTVVIESFVFKPNDAKVDLTVVVTHLSLEELAHFVPQALAGARGRISGRLLVHWSAAEGFTPGPGNLNVASDEGATIKLANSPGLLSKGVNPKISFLPAWLGGVARKTAVDNPAYIALHEIEEGKDDLLVNKLEIALYPDGVDAPRTARISVVAHPSSSTSVKAVSFNVDVIGPLEDLIKVALNQRVDLSVKTSR
jgi:hypothetical protein